MYSGAGDSGFFNSPDERLEVGTVDYTVYDQEMNPYYTKEAMYVYNSPDGYVIEDVLVDGEFVQAKHDISLRFRGSSNQRLLDVKKTLAAGQPVWWEDEKVFATHTMEK